MHRWAADLTALSRFRRTLCFCRQHSLQSYIRIKFLRKDVVMKIDRIQVCALASPPQRVIAMTLDRVPAGYPSPAQDYSDTKIDLSEMLIRDQVSTFIVHVSGDSMQGAGISDGDELIVDRSVQPRDGHVVIAVIDGEMTVKRLTTTPHGVVLKAENPDYPDLRVAELSDFRVWGVATTCLHHL